MLFYRDLNSTPPHEQCVSWNFERSGIDIRVRFHNSMCNIAFEFKDMCRYF